MKKFMAIVLSLLFAFAFVGCGHSSSSRPGDTSGGGGAVVSPQEPGGDGEQPGGDENPGGDEEPGGDKEPGDDEKDPDEKDPEGEEPTPEKEVFRMSTQARSGRAYKILQLTDIQIIDPSQEPYEGRLAAWQKAEWADREQCAFSLVRRLVAQTEPDFIIITGDNIYGQFDGDGSNFIAFVELFESFQIPWSFTFGNHDGEMNPGKGMAWQCEYVKEHTEYCLFDRGEEDVEGYGNCVVDVYDGEDIRCSLIMMDTHGCEGERPAAFTKAQVDWYSRTVRQANKAAGKTVPSMLFFHYPTQQFIDAIETYTPAATGATARGVGKVTANNSHDYGENKEPFTPVLDRVQFWETVKNLQSTLGIFVGHAHVNNSSILYQGVRLTFGSKAGVYDYNDASMQGGTLITFTKSGALGVKHVSDSTENV